MQAILAGDPCWRSLLAIDGAHANLIFVAGF
jgi:hypothetical protein